MPSCPMRSSCRTPNAKLSNEKFMQNAPEAVVQNEKKKLSDATAKIDGLRKTLEALRG